MQSKIQQRSSQLKLLINVYLHRVYANHSKKKGIDLEDVKLASTMLLDKSFTGPPPREVLFEVAKQKNCQPLPTIKPASGLRLPPDRHCLLAANYKLRAASSQAPTKKLVKSALEGSTIKTKLVSSPAGGSSTAMNVIKKPNLSHTMNKGLSVTIPKPTFKVTKPADDEKPLPMVVNDNKMDFESESIGIKRKRSDDYDWAFFVLLSKILIKFNWSGRRFQEFTRIFFATF